MWHHLNCKGRFAGEIRIELTYYDARPKEQKSDERVIDNTINGFDDGHREGSSGVGGPRQPKPIKRRPLPSDPTVTDSSRSSPQPFTPPPSGQHIGSLQQDLPTSSPNTPIENASPIDRRDYASDRGQYRSSPATMAGYDAPNDVAASQIDYSESYVEGGYGRMNGQNIRSDAFVQERHNTPTYDDPAITHQPQDHLANGYSTSPTYDGRYDSSSAQANQDAYNTPKSNYASFLPQHTSMPEFGMHQEQLDHVQYHHRSSFPRLGDYEPNHIRHPSLDDGYGSYSSPNQAMEDEAPPPPPVHRSSGLQSSPKPSGQPHADSYPPVSGPAPLNIRHARSSISASPLSQVHNSGSHPDYDLTSSTATRKPPQSYSSRPPQHAYDQPERRRSPEHHPASPVRDYSQPTPPSLIPGYDPRIADDESERLAQENHSRYRQNSEPVPQYQAFATQRSPGSAQPVPRNDVPLQLRMLENGQDKRPHRASAPIVPRREASPELRTPMRKSVSPQPGPAPGERRQSAVPFGPDSYDTFNPSLNDAASINSAGPKYNTPEQAREAQYDREREAKLAEGPIIGSDGREIDPSDHLPAETWAPEPESKVPKKKPEITIRFKRSPAGAQPMPAARQSTEPISRPGPMVTQTYAHSADVISPTTAARIRLQKKSRIAIAQPVSSPAVPTVHTNVRGVTPRAASEHPLREHGNYGHRGNPAYARTSPRGVPPPIPGKVPLDAGTGQDDWGTSALSEEMRRIDIGVGPGHGRARRNRYGVADAGRY